MFRTIPSDVLTLDDLGAPDIFKTIADNPRGLVLVTGPTGSGKSTTLAAMVDYINQNKHHHILTIEDPIEFVHENKLSLLTSVKFIVIRIAFRMRLEAHCVKTLMLS